MISTTNVLVLVILYREKFPEKLSDFIYKTAKTIDDSDNILTQINQYIDETCSNYDCYQAQQKAEKILQESQENNLSVITPFDECFPAELSTINNPPVILFLRGNKELMTSQNRVAIIGARVPSHIGSQAAFLSGNYLAKKHLTLVGDITPGCNSKALSGAINAKGKAIAVFACGVDVIDHKENAGIVKQLLANDGLIISEYLPGTKPLVQNYNIRNRLVTGLSNTIIACEFDKNSGTDMTLQEALNNNKRIACFDLNEFAASIDQDNNSKALGNIELLANPKVVHVKQLADLDVAVTPNKLRQAKQTKLFQLFSDKKK